MGQGYFPGATIVVARGGKIVYEKSYGYAMLNDMGVRLDDPRPMEMNTMFDMASCTKIMATTQSIMKLYSEGKIDLDATVASYIPEFAKNGKENVTVHQLLTHTSGLPQWKAMFLYIDKDKSKVLDYICNCELMFAPGEEKYSDLGFQMLGFLVERITGRDMDEYVQNEIYKPLNLKRTTYLPLKNGFTTDDLAATSFGNPYEYAMVDEIGHPASATIAPPIWMPSANSMAGAITRWSASATMATHGWQTAVLAGHAGLYSDAEDLAVLCQAMLNGGIYKASACIVRMSLICSPASRTASLPVVWALSVARPLWDAATVTMTHSATRASRYACRDEQDQQNGGRFPHEQAECRV